MNCEFCLVLWGSEFYVLWLWIFGVGCKKIGLICDNSYLKIVKNLIFLKFWLNFCIFLFIFFFWKIFCLSVISMYFFGNECCLL